MNSNFNPNGKQGNPSPSNGGDGAQKKASIRFETNSSKCEGGVLINSVLSFSKEKVFSEDFRDMVKKLCMISFAEAINDFGSKHKRLPKTFEEVHESVGGAMVKFHKDVENLVVDAARFQTARFQTARFALSGLFYEAFKEALDFLREQGEAGR